MKNLVIVESPSKSKTIEKYLGSDYEVVSSKGHIRDLAIKGKDGLGVDVENDFTPTYAINKDKKAVVKELKAKVKDADHVFLATDPDREGEAISWHLAKELELPLDKDNRVVFNEITKDALLEAFKHPRHINIDLVKSQETRRILDRIIGFKLSKLLQSKIKSKSAGRVQSVALNLIVNREKEIEAFVKEEFWSVHALFNEDGLELETNADKYKGKKLELKNNEDATKVVEACQGEFKLDTLKKTTKKRESKPPFITSTLQQEASTKLNFSSKKTMRIAQKLYEGVEINGSPVGLISYMRTDSTRLSNVFISAAHDFIKEQYGDKYVGSYSVKNKKENTQDAHEAIRPTAIDLTPDSIKHALSTDEYKLYRFIYFRALASLMKQAEFENIRLVFIQNDYSFVGTGSRMLFDGYLKVYDYEQSKDKLLGNYEDGKSYAAKAVEKRQHFTEPPLRYSEARLIKELEELGIGRPSTYSSILDTIIIRGYVTLEKASETSKTKVFIPTDQGRLTDDRLQEHFNKIINVKYTANMEQGLDEIADGKRSNIESLREFMDEFTPLLDKANKDMVKIEPEKVGEVCPDCGGELVYRTGRYGKFIACSNFPTCRYNRPLVAREKVEPEKTGEMCPECGSPLVKRKSRFGTWFVGCSNYPKCRYIQPKEKKENKEEAKEEHAEAES